MLLKYWTRPALAEVVQSQARLYQYCYWLMMKSRMAAVSGSENAPGPWYVSKHLSLDAPPSAKQTSSVLIRALPGPTVPVEAVVPVAVHAAAAEDGVVV